MRNRLKELDEKVGPTSPLPYIITLRNLIFGTQKPSVSIQISFFILLTISILSSVWHVMSFLAFKSRSFILENKGIDIQELAELRAIELGLDEDGILNLLQSFHAISAVLWLIIIVALVFLWRQKKVFFWMSAPTFLAAFSMNAFYIGTSYLMKETTSFGWWLWASFCSVWLLVYWINFRSSKTVETEIIDEEQEVHQREE